MGLNLLKIALITFMTISLSNCSDSGFSGASAISGEAKKKQDKQSKKPSKKKGHSADKEASEPIESNNKNQLQDSPEEPDRSQCGGDLEYSFKVRLSFPAVSGCPMGQEGNPEKMLGGEVVSATRTQTQTINLPSNSKLCGLSFDGGSTNFEFDDYLFFTLDEFLFATTVYQASDFTNKGMTEENGLIVYEKSLLIGKGPYRRSMETDGLYVCPREGDCVMPRSETSGQSLSISAPKEHFDIYPEEFFDRQQIKFSAHVTGGRGSFSSDCSHSGMEFDVEVSYVGEAQEND